MVEGPAIPIITEIPGDYYLNLQEILTVPREHKSACGRRALTGQVSPAQVTDQDLAVQTQV